MIYIIIPVHNRIGSTLRNLSSIFASDLKVPFTVIVVDDGSTDGTEEVISEAFPEVIILRGSGSLFWSGAINLGFSYLLDKGAQGDYVYLVNNDVVLKNDTIRLLYNAAVKLDCVVTSLTLNSDGVIQNSGSRIISSAVARYAHPLRGKHLTNVSDFKYLALDFFTGRSVLIPWVAIESVKFIDTVRFPHYGGDEFLSVALRRLGLSIYLSFESRVVLFPNEPKEKMGFWESLWFSLFNIRSGVNLRKTFYFSLYSNSGWRRITNLFSSLLKSLVLSFKIALLRN